MDVIQSQNVKVPDSVLVGGVTGDEVDNEVMEYLGQFGSIGRIIQVTSSEPQFKDTAIVEFKSGEAVQFLRETLPCKRPSSNPNVVHHIRLLSELYAADKSSSLTQSYLTELRHIAKLSGKDFEKVLIDELVRIQESTQSHDTTELNVPNVTQEPQPASSPDQTEPPANVNQPPMKKDGDLIHPHAHDSFPFAAGAGASPSPSHGKRTLYLPSEQLITPEVQKVVVEHVIKNSDISSQYHGHTKLRPFSGKVPCPYLESDYDTWRSNVEFHLTDATVSDKHTVRKIVESLLPPAANVVKHLGPNSTPHDYLCLLDSAYGTVDDGDELFAKFLNTNQNSGERPSGYLQRLQTALSQVVKRGGIAASESERQLLKQFCRGCWNNSLITSLQLEQKKNNPPPFSELLLLLRTEEDRQAAKSIRMRQHLGVPKSKAQSNSLSVGDHVTDDIDTETAADRTSPTNAPKLGKQLAKLQAQIASLKASLSSSSRQASAKPSQKSKAKASTEEKSSSSGESKLTRKPRPGYCFKCGEEGHIASSCSNKPNPELVEIKRKELRQKQQAWEEQNRHDLN